MGRDEVRKSSLMQKRSEIMYSNRFMVKSLYALREVFSRLWPAGAMF